MWVELVSVGGISMVWVVLSGVGRIGQFNSSVCLM